MIDHPHRNWRRAWQVNPTACTVRHETGLRIRFRLDDGMMPPVGTLCLDEGGRIYLGTPTAIPGDLPADRLPRLMREAGVVYADHLNRRS